MKRDYTINENISKIMKERDKKSGAVADRAGIRRDTFSHILHSRRPIYGDELVPIVMALGVPLEDVMRGVQ